jgi:hypothetical protein
LLRAVVTTAISRQFAIVVMDGRLRTWSVAIAVLIIDRLSGYDDRGVGVASVSGTLALTRFRTRTSAETLKNKPRLISYRV